MSTTAKLIEYFSGLVDANGDPLSGYKVRTYAADGSTAQAVWEDRAKTLPSSAGKTNFNINTDGSEEVYGDGVYIIKLWTPTADPDVDDPYDTIGPFGVNVSDFDGTAADVGIVDAGGYYTGTDVEAALQETGAGAVLLAGRSGGQTVTGGTGSGEDLTLISTSHATKGHVIIGGAGDDSHLSVGDYGFEGAGVNIGGVTYASKAAIHDYGSDHPAQFVVHRHSTTLAPVILSVRANDDTTGHTAVTDTQETTRIIGAGWTGAEYNINAEITFEMEAGTISNSSSPGSMKLKVTPDGATVAATAVTIHSNKVANFEVGPTVAGKTIEKTRDDHGTVSTGSEEISADFTHHTLTTAGSHTWTFADFSESRPEFSMKLVVSGGTPTITLTTWTVGTDSAQTLSSMAAGTYWVEGITYDGGTSGQVLVAQVA